MLHDTRRSHTGRDVLAFFRWIDLHVDPDLELHVILGNLTADKSQPVRDGPAHRRNPLVHRRAEAKVDALADRPGRVDLGGQGFRTVWGCSEAGGQVRGSRRLADALEA